jgi:citrate lyase beta subunit
MIIISQNAKNYAIPFPDDTIFRINLAWVNSLDELKDLLLKNNKYKIFLDLPVGRIKPPNNKYTLDEIIPIIKSAKNIKYFAISNIENKNSLDSFRNVIPEHITIVPKIESPQGVKNIDEIVNSLNSSEKVIMLDHDDLYSNILKAKENVSSFQTYVSELKNYCQDNNVVLLRTIGVIFSDEEKRVTDYIG